MKGRPIHQRLGFALAGLIEAHVRESSFRVHVRTLSATLAVLLVVRPAPIWWAAIAIVAALVLALEMLNSALEGLIDLLHPAIHPEVKVIKDMASAAVLVAGIGAAAVAVCALVDSWPRLMAEWHWLMGAIR
ncbi:diacylglycerol kinase [Sphingomonas bacterium]|uniref:diacylglycerol kinase n=1 Tax=Sphingomonas bacterium TaxID=1895847 RepID=UPI0015750CFF|nr:diacylglycerol kinase [Sphingomonas bacterium]